MKNFINFWSYLYESQINEGKHWPEDYKKTAFNTIKNSDLGKTSWYSDEYINQDLDNIIHDFEPLSHKNSNLGFFATIIRWFVNYAGSDRNKYQEFLERKLDNIIQGLLKLTAMPEIMEKSQEIKAWTLDQFESWKKSQDEKSDNQKLDDDFKETGDYDIIPCYTYEELNSKFGGNKTGYHGKSEWCHTNGESTYESWTSNGTKMFFVLAKKGWEKINPKNPYKTNAYDDYGLSLIAILVDVLNNKLLNATLRWNHIIEPSKTKSGATVDKAFDNFAELSKAIGVNVEEKTSSVINKMNKKITDKIIVINKQKIIFNGDNLDLSDTSIKNLNGCPQKIKGWLNCSYCHDLISLKGSPNEINGFFNCSHCIKLSSLENCPQLINGDFVCSDTNLSSLNGCPTLINGSFNCEHCINLTSLENGPKEVDGIFTCANCDNLTSLKGCPQKIALKFDCSYCSKLSSLENGPKEIMGTYCCQGCDNLTSLKGCPEKIYSHFNCSYCSKLTSLENGPKEVDGIFNCEHCDNLISFKGAPSIVAGQIYGPKHLKDELKEYKKWLKHPTSERYMM